MFLCFGCAICCHTVEIMFCMQFVLLLFVLKNLSNIFLSYKHLLLKDVFCLMHIFVILLLLLLLLPLPPSPLPLLP